MGYSDHHNSRLSAMIKERFTESISNFSYSNTLSSSDSFPPSASPYLSCICDSCMASPASVTTDTDNDFSPSSSHASTDTDDDISLSSSHASSPCMSSPASVTTDTDDDDSLLSSHTSPYSGHDERFIYATHLHDDNLSPLGLSRLHLFPLSESEPQPKIKHAPIYSPPSLHSFFDYDSSIPAPCSPSLRRSTTLPELEPANFNPDPFGLHGSIHEAPPDIDMDMPDIGLHSLPGWETDDDLIPVELASKKYIPDPSAIVPTTSTGTRSLLLWDHDHNNRSDMLIPRSPSPEDFYLDSAVLEECGDEEIRKVYELRQRTAKNEKWERERCRELSTLLKLKLDERGILGRATSVLNSPPSSDSTFPSTSGNPLALPEAPKHKIKSMAQLVASMLSNRQSDTFRRHPPRKTGFGPTSSCHFPHPLPMGGAWTKVLPTPRSRLSKVILPEELADSESVEGAGAGVENGDETKEEENRRDMNVDVDNRLNCRDVDLDERGWKNSSHTVTWAAPSCADTNAQLFSRWRR